MKSNTKEKILDESLKLFATNGFDAVSIRTIASAVGITNSGLYKHFKSKREIFDSIVENQKQHYLSFCSIANSNIRGIKALKKVCFEMFDFQTQDEKLNNFRKLLIVEKFKDKEIDKLYKNFFIDIPLNNLKNIFEELIKKGLMINGDYNVFALEFYSPFYLYQLVSSNNNKKEDRENRILLEKHIENFFEKHFIKEDN